MLRFLKSLSICRIRIENSVKTILESTVLFKNGKQGFILYIFFRMMYLSFAVVVALAIKVTSADLVHGKFFISTPLV